MAGDWIKMRGNLEGSPKVHKLAAWFFMPEAEVISLLYRVASWFQRSGKYGKMELPESAFDRHMMVDGLAERLMELGWLGSNRGVITLHEFCTVSTERKSFGVAVRARVLGAGACAACGSTGKLEIDHKTPISRGGSCDDSNLQALCVPCNRSKGRKTDAEWRAAR